MRVLKTKRLLAFAAGLVLVLGVAACGDDDDSDDGGGGGGGETALDLTIGDSLPLTGDLADFGPPGQKAADLAVAEINAAIKEAGVDHTVKVVHEDNETNPQAAVQAARKMVDSDGASCIAGAWASADTIPTAQSVAIPEGVAADLARLDDATRSRVSTTRGWSTGRPRRTRSRARPWLTRSPQDLGGAEGKTVNIGARNDAYGNGSRRHVQRGLGRRWAATIGAEVHLRPRAAELQLGGPADHRGQPRRDSRSSISRRPSSRSAPRCERTGDWDPKKAWSPTVSDPAICRPTPARRRRGHARHRAGRRPTRVRRRGVRHSVHEFEPKDVDRQTFDAQNFDAVMLCYLAAVAAGSTDGAGHGGRAPGRQRARAATVHLASSSPRQSRRCRTVTTSTTRALPARIDLDENGDATAGVYDIYEFKGGELETIGEVPVASPSESRPASG